jgi:hypothetical protein
MATSRQKPLRRESVANFRGVNLRVDSLSSSDESVMRSINADLHVLAGVILPRHGRSLQTTTALGTGDQPVRTLARRGTTRYRVVGETLYRDATAIANVTLSTNRVTTMTHFRPLNDPDTWTFVADDAVMRKDNGTNNRTWGITPPSVAPTLRPTAGGRLDAGTYTVVYTYVRKEGDAIAHESNPSPESDPITLESTNNAIAVTGFSRSDQDQVTHIRFYRTVVDGVTPLYETEISNDTTLVEYGVTQAWENDSDNLDGAGSQFTQVATYDLSNATSEEAVTVTYNWEEDFNAGLEPALHRTQSGMVSSTPTLTSQMVLLRVVDSALGTAVETDNDVPPTASWCTAFQEHMFLCRDAANPHYLWYSKRFRPESVPSTNYLEIGDPADPLQCAVPLVGFLGVFTRRTKYRVLGNDTSGFVAIEALNTRGTPAPQAVVVTELGAVFPARDGLYVTNFVSPDVELSQRIEPLFHGEHVHDYAPIDWNRADEQRMAFWKGRLYWGYVDTLGTRMLAVYSRDTQHWYFYEQPFAALSVEEDLDQLTMGDTTGSVSVLEDPTVQTDAGSAFTTTVWLAPRAVDDPYRRKLFQFLQVDAECLDDTLTVQFYLDDALAHTVSVTGSRTRQLLRLPGGCLGRVWQLRLSYSGSQRVAFYGAEVQALALEKA